MNPGRYVLAVVACLAPACAGDAMEPVAPMSLVVTAGDQQTGCSGAALPDSLEVTLTGSDNRPFAGAPVAWQVTSGVATLSRALDTTDAAGRSRVQLSLVGESIAGAQLAGVTATATVTGLSPAAFSAGRAFTPYALGQIVSGALAPGDCSGPPPPEAPFYFDSYILTLSGPQSFTASLTSAAFDARLDVLETNLPLLAINDDSADGSGGTNSFLKLIVAGGTYVFGVSSSSPRETGSYTLATQATPVAVENCLFDVWVTRGITTNQEIKTTDCVDASGPFYFDAYRILLWQGQTLTVTESSTAFDAELFLFNANTLAGSDPFIGSDDNSGGGTNARLTYQASSDQYEFVYVVPATKGSGETGAYTLTIDPPTAVTSARLPPLRSDRAFNLPCVPKSRLDFPRSWRRLGR